MKISVVVPEYFSDKARAAIDKQLHYLEMTNELVILNTKTDNGEIVYDLKVTEEMRDMLVAFSEFDFITIRETT